MGSGNVDAAKGMAADKDELTEMISIRVSKADLQAMKRVTELLLSFGNGALMSTTQRKQRMQSKRTGKLRARWSLRSTRTELVQLARTKRRCLMDF